MMDQFWKKLKKEYETDPSDFIFMYGFIGFVAVLMLSFLIFISEGVMLIPMAIVAIGMYFLVKKLENTDA